jgi:Domain of unknown function (DUF397)
MAAHNQDLSHATWRKSTYSSQDGNCVEMSASIPGVIAVRDSKDPDGPVLRFSSSVWVAFIKAVGTGEA